MYKNIYFKINIFVLIIHLLMINELDGLDIK